MFATGILAPKQKKSACIYSKFLCKWRGRIDIACKIYVMHAPLLVEGSNIAICYGPEQLKMKCYLLCQLISTINGLILYQKTESEAGNINDPSHLYYTLLIILIIFSGSSECVHALSKFFMLKKIFD
jgi:hypothetical protein